jgi:hypothetical protein
MFNELKNKVFQDAELLADVRANMKDFFVVFLSVCDMNTRARVFTGTGRTLESAWSSAERQCNARISSARIPLCIKADIVDHTETISQAEYAKRQADSEYMNFCRLGVSFGRSFKTAFIEAEVNCNKMYDWKAKLWNLDNINKYLKKNRDAEPMPSIPNQLTVFTAYSFFQDETGKVTELYANDDDFGRRIVNVNAQFIQGIIDGASRYLAGMMKDDGSFIYGYSPAFGKELGGYNILRHIGSLWALLNYYRDNPSKKLRAKLQRSIDYFAEDYVKRYDSFAFILEKKSSELKLGGNGIAIVTLSIYRDVFKSAKPPRQICGFVGDPGKYDGLIAELAEGILFAQNDDGSFNHVYNEDLTLKADFRTVYYDGEAAFGLTLAYALTQDKRYLDAAERAVAYFIREDYAQYRDHWIAYTMREITKHVPKPEYFKFALDNVLTNLEIIYMQKTSYHTYMELLMAGYETYLRSPFVKEEITRAIKATIHRRAEHMLNGYCFPETAMYMKKPRECVNAFFVRHDNFRIRIDDLQHFLGGYRGYVLNES